MLLFLDANVLFTAAISPGGASRALVRLSAAGACRLAASPFAIDEARRNVGVKRPDRRAELDVVLATLDRVGDARPDLLTWAVRHVVAKDAPILAAAVGAHADVLVTGDRTHFGDLYGRTVRGLRVEPPRVALRLVLDDGP